MKQEVKRDIAIIILIIICFCIGVVKNCQDKKEQNDRSAGIYTINR